MTRSPQEMENRHRLEAILTENFDLFGPRNCEHGPWHECPLEESCPYDETVLAPNVMMGDFVIVASVTYMDSSEGAVTMECGPSTTEHRWKGLLYMAMNEM